MYFHHDDTSDVHLRKTKSLTIKSLLENKQEIMSSEAMISFTLKDNPKDDIKLTITSWFRKRYKIFLLHYGSSLNEILIENQKVDYFLDMGVGGGGFSYKQILEDFFSHIEEKHGPIVHCEVFFL